jgi:hypothetical protein
MNMLKEKESSATRSVVPTRAVSTAVQTIDEAKVGVAINAVRRTGAIYLAGILVVVAFISLMAKGIVSAREGEGPGAIRLVSPTTATRFDPQRFILNGLLVPSLDTDAVPLRWVDPRPAMHCRPAASVRVNGDSLVPGDLVPNVPFEIEWHADGCQPFGASGPRFDGDVKITVFREDWGCSALVTPHRLRITTPWHPLTVARPGAATIPQSVPEGELLLGE